MLGRASPVRTVTLRESPPLLSVLGYWCGECVDGDIEHNRTPNIASRMGANLLANCSYTCAAAGATRTLRQQARDEVSVRMTCS